MHAFLAAMAAAIALVACAPQDADARVNSAANAAAGDSSTIAAHRERPTADASAWMSAEDIAFILSGAGLEPFIPDPEDACCVLRFPTYLYRDSDGEEFLILRVEAVDWLGAPAIRIIARGVHSLQPSRFRFAAIKAATEHARIMNSSASFTYDADTDALDASMVVPIGAGNASSAMIREAVRQVYSLVDDSFVNVRHAADTGVIERTMYHSDERFSHAGPERGDQGGPRDPIRIGVRVAPVVCVTTLLGADSVRGTIARAEADALARCAGVMTLGVNGRLAESTGLAWRRALDRANAIADPICVRVWGPAGTKATATASAPGLIVGDAVGSAWIGNSGYVDVHLEAKWDEDALRALTEVALIPVQCSVECGTENLSREGSVRVVPPQFIDLGMPAALSLACMVDEGHPWARAIADRVVATSGVPRKSHGSVAAYADVLGAAFAAWKEFRAYGVAFGTPDDEDLSAGPETRSQRVRRLPDVLVDRRANCADGTVAFASVLLALGLDVYVVTVPEHVFVAVGCDGGEDLPDWVAIETTMLDACADSHLQRGSWPPAAIVIADRFATDPDWASFANAVDRGAIELAEALEKANASATSLKTLRAVEVRPVALGGVCDAPAPLPAPDPVAAAAARAEACERQAKAEAAERAWADGLPPVDCVAYPTIEALERDVLMLNHDPLAMARLLAAVDGDGTEQRCMRLVSRLRAADGPARVAMSDAFAPEEPYGGVLLNLPDYASAVHAVPLAPGRVLLLADSRDGDDRHALPIVVVRDGFAIDGPVLCSVHPEVGNEAVAVVRQVDPQLFVTPGAFDEWVRWTVELACSGDVASYGEMIELIATEFVGRLGGGDRFSVEASDPLPF